MGPPPPPSSSCFGLHWEVTFLWAAEHVSTGSLPSSSLSVDVTYTSQTPRFMPQIAVCGVHGSHSCQPRSCGPGSWSRRHLRRFLSISASPGSNSARQTCQLRAVSHLMWLPPWSWLLLGAPDWPWPLSLFSCYSGPQVPWYRCPLDGMESSFKGLGQASLNMELLVETVVTRLPPTGHEASRACLDVRCEP